MSLLTPHGVTGRLDHARHLQLDFVLLTPHGVTGPAQKRRRIMTSSLS